MVLGWYQNHSSSTTTFPRPYLYESVYTEPPSFKDAGYIKLSGPRQGLELGRLLKFKGQEK